MVALEVKATVPKVDLLDDFRFYLDPPDPNSLVAPKRSFVRIVAQTNAFPKMDILIKPLAFMDADEQAIFLSPEEIEFVPSFPSFRYC